MIGVRVVIGGTDAKTVRKIEEMLKVLGSITVGRACDEIGAIKAIRATQPDYIILEGGLAFVDVAKTVEENGLAPLLMITDRESWRCISSVMDTWGFDYLEKPVKAESLKMKMQVGIDKHRKNRETVMESERIHSQKTTRNIVEKAKGILVKNLGLSEMQALHRIQVLGHERGVSVRDMAEKIIRNSRLQDALA